MEKPFKFLSKYISKTILCHTCLHQCPRTARSTSCREVRKSDGTARCWDNRSLSGSYLLLDDSYRLLDGSYPLLSDSYRLLSDSYRSLDGSYPLLSDSYRLLNDSYRSLGDSHPWNIVQKNCVFPN